MNNEPCKHCGACDCCDRCNHCGHCRKCGKYIALPYWPGYQPIWIQPYTPQPYYPTWTPTITWGNTGITGSLTGVVTPQTTTNAQTC
jgi:hypothetical protein